MGDLKEELIAKTMGIAKKSEPTMSDVEKEASNMDVIDKTMETAKKLAGTDALAEELKNKDRELEESEKGKNKVTEELQETKMEVIQKELGGKIDQLSEAMKSGASTKSIGEQITDIKKTATELGIGTSKVSEFKEMATLIQSLSPQQKGLAEQVKEAKELLDIMQPKTEKEAAPVDMPPSMVLEIKKMDTNLQITLEEMKDGRQRKDQEFQLTMTKWEEERALKIREVEGKLVVERERNELIAGGLDRLGRVFAQATSETEAPPQSQRVAAIQAGEGEYGEVTCINPKCQATVPIARDAVKAVCPGCGTPYNINRIKREIPAGQAEEPGSELAEGAET